MKLDRKDFFKTALLIAGAGMGLTEIGACGGDDSSGATDGGTGTGGAGGGGPGSGGGAGTDSGASDGTATTNACELHEPAETIAANHGHVLNVTMADAAAGVDKTYDIMGTATHTHSVSVTAAMFGMLRSGATISTTSSTNSGHSHGITVVCA